MNKKIQVLDFLKGYSILSIVIFHFAQSVLLPSWAAKMINFGGTGVHTFVFVSGFGLYLSNLNKPLSFVEFINKRFIKIYIPYIIIVTISALISLLMPIYSNSAYAFFGHVFLYKMFDESIVGSYGYQLWFISLIVQLYLVFPLLTRLRECLSATTFLFTGLAISVTWGLLVLVLGKSDLRIWNSFFLQNLWEFILGMYCAELFFRKKVLVWEIRPAYLWAVSISGIAIYGSMALFLGQYGKLLNDIPALFGYTALSICIYNLKIKWINQFVIYTGFLSYPLYLVHFLILLLIKKLTLSLGISFSWPILLPVLILCYLSSYFLEKLFTQINRSLLDSKPGDTKISAS